MSQLNNQQKQLLFDYCLGLTFEQETTEAEELISSNEKAAEIHSKLKAALEPLDSLEPEACPDELAEGTIWRLNNLARSSQLQLQQLLADEQAKGLTTKGHFWRNLIEMAAVAAVILFVAGIWVPTSNFARQRYRQLQCRMQLSQIAQGIDRYKADYNSKLPAVATITGTPWWKVGYQGKENHSNTRHMWLLVKGGYVEPDNFVCPGRRQGQVIKLDPLQVKNYNDFPGRKYVTYSFRIMCPKSKSEDVSGRKVLMADLNPLFEGLPRNYSKPLKLRLNKSLLNLNSINHNSRGQNVLFCDGSVTFVKKRRVGISEDDIFTLQDTDIYEGIEVPTRETDAFLAP
jgi:prepilin-type processing-associated H-X9-DG protein